jgi:hypothetical protein
MPRSLICSSVDARFLYERTVKTAVLRPERTGIIQLTFGNRSADRSSLDPRCSACELLMRYPCAAYFSARVGFCASLFWNRGFPREFWGCSVPVLSAQKPWFSQDFSNIGPIALAFLPDSN